MRWRYLAIALLAGSSGALSQVSGPQLRSADAWQPSNVPFSFRYGRKPSAKLLHKWRFVPPTSGTSETPGVTEQQYVYADPHNRLEITAVVRTFAGFPGVADWVVRFHNTGHKDTGILQDILPLDLSFVPSSAGAVVHHARGSTAVAADFEPLDESLAAGGSVHLHSTDGRSSSGDTLPFFNLQSGHGGLIGAIGWSGDWKADLSSAADGSVVRVTAGMQRTHLRLHPGEEIRTPRIVLMAWSGNDWQEAQNAWRRLLFAHYTPQQDGKPMLGPVMAGSWGADPIAGKLAYVQWLQTHAIPVDLYAVDAGWFGASVGAENDPTNPWWKNRGDWFPSPLYYPHGIAPLGAALKAAGYGFSLWVEPETAMPGTQILTQHPEWFLHTPHPANPGASLLRLGDPAARQGATALLSGLITDFGMTWYRQDFNISPQPYWELADAPDRVGMTEIQHITGMYQMLDDLLAAHPGLRIDNCASGGRRLDIEMLSRSFAVWRTDFAYFDTLAEQAQTQQLALWVPQNNGFDTYTLDSPWTRHGPYSSPANFYLMRLGYNVGYGLRPGDIDVENAEWLAWIKDALAEYREVQPYFQADFYALLPYSRSDAVWTAWQLDRPEDGSGVVVVLRRPKSPDAALCLQLRHLDPNASYAVEMRRTHAREPTQTMSGSELGSLALNLESAPSSLLVFYRRLPAPAPATATAPAAAR